LDTLIRCTITKDISLCSPLLKYSIDKASFKYYYNGENNLKYEKIIGNFEYERDIKKYSFNLFNILNEELQGVLLNCNFIFIIDIEKTIWLSEISKCEVSSAFKFIREESKTEHRNKLAKMHTTLDNFIEPFPLHSWNKHSINVTNSISKKVFS